MITSNLHRKPPSGFAGRLGFWVVALVVLLASYQVISASHFWGRPDAIERLLAMVLRNLPVGLGQILPPAVFAAALTGPAHIGEPGIPSSTRHWVFLGTLSLAAYVLVALVEPLLAPVTGSDWQFPPSLLHAAESARAAAEEATGREARSHMRDAASALAGLVVPIANAAFVVVAGVLGDLAGRLTHGLSDWPRYVARWLSGGFLFAAFWIPLDIAAELVAYQGASASLLFVLPLSVPLLSVVVLFFVVRTGRGRVP